MGIKVSVIMPVYNGEKYLREVLDSIRNQTLEEYELICINDGSTDSTQEILKEYEMQDKRIHVIQNRERTGAALSRNKALKIARGEYLCFADADDPRSKDMLEHTYDAAKKNCADVVIYGIVYFKDGQLEECVADNHLEAFKEKYCTNTFTIKESTSLEDIQLTDNLVNKIFRRDFVLEQGLWFQNLSCSNDVYFVMMSLYLAKKILCVKEVLAFQRDHQTPTRISYYRDPMCAVKAWEKIAGELKRLCLWEEIAPRFVMRFLYSMQYAFRMCSNKQRCQEVYDHIRRETLKSLDIKKCSTYFQINGYIRKWLTLMEKEEKEDVWLSEWDYMAICMEERPEVMENLFGGNGKKIFIWGGGKHGRSVARYCRQHSFGVSAIIDNSPALYGTEIEGIPVVRFDDIADDMDMVAVSSSWFYDDVYRQIRKRNTVVEIVDLVKCFLSDAGQ